MTTSHPAKKIRVLIADDHAIVRMGLTALINAEKDMLVVAQAKNGDDAIQLANKFRPDVIVMDLLMPKTDGVEATRCIHDIMPECRILILTSYGTADGIAHALEFGAAGALIKSAENEELTAAIRAVLSCKRILSPEIESMLKTQPPISKLTPRQHDILNSLVRGQTNKEIASQLGICKDVVDEYIATLLAKLGAANRTEAVAIALRKHLLKI